MLDVKTHEIIMKSILRDVYKDTRLQAQLVFKGGTCLYLFYDLPRFSTDLDFSLEKGVELESLGVSTITKILGQYLDLSQIEDKRFTWLWVGSFAKGKQKIKFEISKRRFKDTYSVHDFYGLTVRTLSIESMFAHKICAVTDRREIVNRDLYDVWWLLKKRIRIREEIVKERTGRSLVDYLLELKKYIDKSVKKRHILGGLGEVLDQSQKDWVRDHLIDELLFEIQMRIEFLR